MAVIFLEGFDKYGVPNSNNTTASYYYHAGALMMGDWSTAGSTSIVAGLSATGGAYSQGVGGTIGKTLGANYSRIIGGFRFSSNLVSTNWGIAFYDAGTSQFSITINSTGNISIRTGPINGTVIATAGAFAANSVHYLEWDVTVSPTGAYQVWLDGVLLLSGTGNTRQSANNYINAIYIGGGNGSPANYVDDLYLFDTTGSTNNAVLLTSPRIETTFPTSEASVQFTVGASTVGTTYARSTWMNTNVGGFYVRQVIPARNCTINSVAFVGGASSASVNHRGVVYADTGGGLPGTLMASSASVTGLTNEVIKTLPLTTPQALVGGTPYWIGVMTDTAVLSSIYLDTGGTARSATVTYASGAPATAPATSSINTPAIWGNVTPYDRSLPQVLGSPVPGVSYVYDSVVGHEDLYNFAPFLYPPLTIYATAVKALVAKSDSGVRTVSMRMKSGSTDSPGSLAGQAPGSSQGWMGSYFANNPDGNVPWTAATLNAAQSGFKIDS